MALTFPPLLSGVAVAGEPFETAVAAAHEADPGTVFYAPSEDVLRAAILLAPETPLREAVSVCFSVALGLNDAVGALAPPEVAFHFEWPGVFRVNGAACGAMRVAASSPDLDAEPDWLVVGIEVPVAAQMSVEPGDAPDATSLHDEGCGDVLVPDLIETWARHMMNWLHIYMTDGFGPLHEDWCARAWKLGKAIETPEPGTFVGLDEWGGMILKTGEGMRILKLTQILEGP